MVTAKLGLLRNCRRLYVPLQVTDSFQMVLLVTTKAPPTGVFSGQFPEQERCVHLGTRFHDTSTESKADLLVQAFWESQQARLITLALY